MISPQEEETLALAAIRKLGEASAHDIATELGVMTVRHTLGRLVDAGRVERRRLTRAHGDVWVFKLTLNGNGNGYCANFGCYERAVGKRLCDRCHQLATQRRAALAN
jgi:predicted ArsR family transcriptional regulator